MTENNGFKGALSSEELLDQVTIGRVEDIRMAAENLNVIARLRGMHVAVHDDISTRQPMVDADGHSLNAQVFGWATPDCWWDHPRFALYSPIMRACLYTNEPFWCNAQGIYSHQENKYLDSIDTTAFFSAEGCNISALIVVPVHLPFGQVSTNSFPSVDASLKNLARQFEKHGLLLGALTRRFIADYTSVFSKSDPDLISSRYTLSNREVECVKLVALGKTDVEIGAKLSLCRSTIRYHIQQAATKLGTANRIQTAVKAAQMGYLGAGGGYTIR